MFSKLKSIVCFALLFCLVLTGCGRNDSSTGKNSSGKSLQIKGSDTMVNLGQAWAEAYSKKNPEMNIGVTGGGSGTGFASLINKTCDIATS